MPKFYHDAFEQDLYQVGPEKFSDELLTRMFLRSSSPLSEEADTWFLRELRGRSLSMLTFLADHAGCSNGELLAGVGAPEEKTQISAYLGRLVTNYEMISKLNPVFSDGKSRNARYYIADNFPASLAGSGQACAGGSAHETDGENAGVGAAAIDERGGFRLRKTGQQTTPRMFAQGQG